MSNQKFHWQNLFKQKKKLTILNIKKKKDSILNKLRYQTTKSI